MRNSGQSLPVAAGGCSLLAAERDAAFREAFLHLPRCCQRLIAQLIQDPPVPYAEISTTPDIPVSSIGPIRGRCLDRLRHYPAIAALINAETESARQDQPFCPTHARRPRQ